MQVVQVVDFVVDLIDVLCQVDIWCVVFELVLYLGVGMLVQYCLYYGEFVQVGVEQGLDDYVEFMCVWKVCW